MPSELKFSEAVKVAIFNPDNPAQVRKVTDETWTAWSGATFADVVTTPAVVSGTVLYVADLPTGLDPDRVYFMLVYPATATAKSDAASTAWYVPDHAPVNVVAANGNPVQAFTPSSAETGSDGRMMISADTHTAGVTVAAAAALGTQAKADVTAAVPTAAQVRQEIDANSTKLDAAVSTRATPAEVKTQADQALTDKGLTALAVAGIAADAGSAATNAATAATHATTLVGRPSALTAQQTRDAMLLARIGSPAADSLDAIAAAGGEGGEAVWTTEEKDQVLAQVNKLTSGTTYVVAFVNGRDVRITKGDSYLAANGPTLDFAMPEGAGWPTDLTGWTIAATANRTSQCADQSGVESITFAGSVVTASGVNRKVRLEPTSAQTSTMSVGSGGKGYAYTLSATKDGERVTLLQGNWSVSPEQSTA